MSKNLGGTDGDDITTMKDDNWTTCGQRALVQLISPLPVHHNVCTTVCTTMCTTPGWLYYTRTRSWLLSEVIPVTLLHCCMLASVSQCVLLVTDSKSPQTSNLSPALIMIQASMDTVRSNRGLNRIIRKLILASLNPQLDPLSLSFAAKSWFCGRCFSSICW